MFIFYIILFEIYMIKFLQNTTIAFSYSTRSKTEIAKNSDSHWVLNAWKFAAYIPLIGPISQIFVCAFAINDKLPKATIAAFVARAAFSPISPILLPLDFVGTIVYALTKNKN